MRARNLIAALVTSGLLAAAAIAAAPDWPCWRGPNRDGKSTDKGLVKEWPAGGPKQLWKNESIGQGFSTPTFGDGLAFVTGDADSKLMLFALDPADGKEKWKAEVCPAWRGQYDGIRSTPTFADGKVYVLSPGGLLACLDVAKNGQKLWAKEMKEFGGAPHNWGYAESPLVYEKLVIVTPGGKTPMVAFDKATGVKVWASSGFAAAAHYSSAIAAVVDKVPMIVQGSGSGIFAVDPKDGKTLWSNGFASGNVANCPTPAFSDGYVFWANGYGKGGICLKLSVADGKVTATQAWTTRDMDCHHGGYVIVDGCIYGNAGGGWACLDLKSGAKKWSDRGVGKGSICYADGMLYLFGEGGGKAGLAVASPEKFESKGTFSVAGRGPSWAHPVVTGGRLYLRYGTNLYAFDVAAK
ncbi:MAG: PQQ-like beta-propeller repeat protein [Phycisphaerae bacterium]|nr:PQQ-like beta-propeller repeat protein [Phycisphaerae bacterium]